MKLNARKSIAAIGTAMALAVTPVAVPTMAPTAFAAVSVDNFNKRWGQVKNGLTELEKLYTGAEKKVKVTSDAVVGNSDAAYKIDEARVQLSIANGLKMEASNTFDDIKIEDVSDANYGQLDSANTAISKAITALNRVDTSLNEARSAKKKAEDSKFTCPGASNLDENGDVSDGSSMDGLKSMFTSSGNRVVYKNGKKECISNREYYTDMLTKLVAVLGTVLTLITTATKISDVVMKANPMAPAE